MDYDEEIQKVNLEMMRLTEKRAEMAGRQDVDKELELKMEMVSNALAHIPNGITAFDEMTVRQMVSSIKVLDKSGCWCASGMESKSQWKKSKFDDAIIFDELFSAVQLKREGKSPVEKKEFDIWQIF